MRARGGRPSSGVGVLGLLLAGALAPDPDADPWQHMVMDLDARQAPEDCPKFDTKAEAQDYVLQHPDLRLEIFTWQREEDE